MKHFPWKIFLLLPVISLLSGCYIPYAYLTKIEIAQNGRYSLNFQGRVVSANFLKKIQHEEISVGDEKYEVEKTAHMNELQRLGFTNSQYVYPASYETNYKVKGNLFTERMVTFPSRAGSVLVIKLLKDNKVIVKSQRLNQTYINQLEESGIIFVGNIALWTDIPVLKHNADSVVPGTPADAYAWKMDSLDKEPIELVGVLGNE